MFDRLMGEIRGFAQHPNESLVDAWLRIKDLLRSRHGHGLGRGTIIQIFYHGLDKATQAILDAGGINEAHRLLKDRFLLKLDWSKYIKDKPLRKTVAFAEREEANYAYEGYRGNYYGRSFENWRARQPRDDNRNSQPREDNPSNLPTSEKKFEESDFKKTIGKTYDLPFNPNAKTTNIHDNIEDEADEAEKEMKERYAKFIDLIKEVRITVSLVDVLVDMPNYGKFLKDLVSNKSKMEQISVAFLNEECSAIIQNKLQPKLGDPGSFLIPCTLANSVEYLALADLGASINLMPYSLYASLSENTLKPTRMNIRLANHTYQYPMGVAENMLVQVGKFVFPVDFVILQIEEDDKVPLILGRPFLHTVDGIIRVKNKELNLGVRDDRTTFLIYKAMQHSHSNDDTCFRMDVIDEVTKEKLDAFLDDSDQKRSTKHLSTKNSKNSWLSMSKKLLNKRKKSKTILKNCPLREI
ncbi:reverse transcriptase domain-containing protein [Tanacetum coccineum]